MPGSCSKIGVPAVGSGRDAAQELIDHGYNGDLVAPGETVGLITMIERLYEDRRLLYKLTLNALHTFRSRPGRRETPTQLDRFSQHLVP